MAKAGLPAVQAHTYYHPEIRPGAPPGIIAVPYAKDVKALQGEIGKAKQQADVVIDPVFPQPGLPHVAKNLCMYRQPPAHAAIEAGADLLLGHQTRSIDAAEVYKGKGCSYSNGKFMTAGPKGRDRDVRSEPGLVLE